MIGINGLTIVAGQGDSGVVRYNPVHATDGDCVIFEVRTSYERKILIYKVLYPNEDMSVDIPLDEVDTTLDTGAYVWQCTYVKTPVFDDLFVVDGALYTPEEPGVYMITEVVNRLVSVVNFVDGRHGPIVIRRDMDHAYEWGYADRLATSRYIQLTGDLEGSVLFDGSKDVEIDAEVAKISLNDLSAILT